MGELVCRKKPNRTYRRLFTPNDLTRIVTIMRRQDKGEVAIRVAINKAGFMLLDDSARAVLESTGAGKLISDLSLLAVKIQAALSLLRRVANYLALAPWVPVTIRFQLAGVVSAMNQWIPQLRDAEDLLAQLEALRVLALEKPP